MAVPNKVEDFAGQRILAMDPTEFAPYRQTNRLLDIGCGAGNLLLAARKNGWTGYGLDVSENSVKHVRSLGFEVFQQLFSARGLKGLLREVGFRETRVRTTGGNPIEIFHAMGRKKDAPKTSRRFIEDLRHEINHCQEEII